MAEQTGGQLLVDALAHQGVRARRLRRRAAAGRPADGRDRRAVAARLADFTGLDVTTLCRTKLRIEMEDFRRELLGQEGKRIGRFDARFCADHQYVIGTGAFDPATDDAATAGVSSAHLSGFHQHLATDLGYHSHLHYRPLSNVTIEAAWDWRHKAPGIDAPLQVPNVALDTCTWASNCAATSSSAGMNPAT